MTNNLTMQELLEQQEQEFNQVKAGQTITGKISKITNDEVVVELNYGFDGVIKNEELNLPKGKYASDVYKVGDEITAVITRVYQKDGIINLSKLQLDETDDYVGKNLEVYIKELDAKKNRIVATHREVLQERLDKEREERRARIKAEKEAERARIKAEKEAHIAKVKAEKEELFNSLEVGQKREGKVTKLMPYGAFVDIGGIEGLLHLNNLSWEKVESVEDMLSEGQEVQVYVLDIDKENKKFALALKDINNDPWELIKQDVQLDDIVSGEVVRIIEKGAIVKIREGVDAFLPISELSEERVIKVSSVVNIGDTVNAMVIEFKPKNRRMVLSIKEANREPEEDYSEYLETEDSLGSLGELFKDKFKNLQK